MSAYQDAGFERVLDIDPSPNNPRNSEGSVIELRDGSLMLAYSRFEGGDADDAAAQIAARYSHDRGRTWSNNDTIIIPNEGDQNVMSVSLLRLFSGEMAIFYLVRNSLADTRLYMRKSGDACKTWGEKVLCISREGYFVVNNDRVVQLSNGRLIFPAAYHPSVGNDLSGLELNGRCTCFYSDDSGDTWKPGETVLSAPESAAFVHPDYAGKVVTDGVFQEPGVVELSDGRLMMWMRTNLGCQYKSYSSDGGITWTAAEPSDLICPLGPASIKRIPSTGDLLVLYNDHSGRFPYDKERRVPLVSAISKDDGATWQYHRLVESDLSEWYCYTLISFIDEYIILGYSVHLLNSMRMSRIPISWFYGE